MNDTYKYKRDKIIEEVVNELLREGYNIEEISKEIKEYARLSVIQEKRLTIQDVVQFPEDSMTL